MVDNTRARQNTNKENAIALAKIGVAVFPSSGKTPLVPMFNRLDTEISPADRDAAIEKYREDHDDKSPIHVGCTKDLEVIKRMWRAFRDAVPSIATGPSGLVVLDADQKDDGPAKMAELFKEHGGLPEGARATPTKSGGRHFIFADPDRSFSNKAGALKKDYGTDVRGSGGQIVAPGSMLEDGRSYGSRDDLVQFMRAFNGKSFPPLPDYVVELIGAAAEFNDAENVAPSKERDAIKLLQDADWDKHENDFDPDLGSYDLDQLRATNAEFKELYDNPAADCSTNRFLAARHVMREWPDMPAPALSIFFSQWEGAGEYTDEKPKSGQYDDRQIAREWLKNQGLSKPSSGDAFGAVVDEDEDPEEAALEAYSKQIEAERKEEREEAEKSANAVIRRANDLVATYEPLDYVVNRTIPRCSVGALYGAPNVGKSFLGLDVSQAVRRGRPWFGRRTEQCDVLYLYGEGHAGVAGRLKAWYDNNDSSGGDIAIRDGIPNLYSDKRAVLQIEKAIKDCMTESGLAVGLVVIDTFSKAVAGADEDKATEMNVQLIKLRKIATTYNLAILIIHHSGKDASRGMRGSTAILGDVDFAIEVTEDKKGLLRMAVKKMRDARKSDIGTFKLKEVVIGQDRHKEPVSSCIIVPHMVAPIEAGVGMGAVSDPDDPATEDKLAPITAERENEQRMKKCERFVELMRKHGGRTKEGVPYIKLTLLAKLIPELATMKAESKKDFAQTFKDEYFHGEPEEFVEGGTLRYVRGSRGESATLQFIAGE